MHTVSTHLAARLHEVGIRHCFVVTGDYTSDILEGLQKRKDISLIPCCNELNAGYAADGYSRATGIGAVFCTYNVGSFSLMNAVAGAYAEDVPLIVICGAPPAKEYSSNRALHHSVDLCKKSERHQALNMMKHITAYAALVLNEDGAAHTIDTAIMAALHHKKPVYIEISCTVASLPVKSSSPLPLGETTNRPSMVCRSGGQQLQGSVQELTKLWERARRGVIIVGRGVQKAGAEKDVEKLVSVLNCPVAVTPDGKGIFPEDHGSFIGTYWGELSSPGCRERVEESDFQLWCGVTFSDYVTLGYSVPLNNQNMAVIETERILLPDVEFEPVLMAEFFSALAAHLSSKSPIGRVVPTQADQKLNQSQEPLSVRQGASLSTPAPTTISKGSTASTVPPSLPGKSNLDLSSVAQQIQGVLSEKHALMMDVGTPWFLVQKLALPNGVTVESQMQYASLGWALPASLGYQLGQGERKRLVLVIGDGSFQMSGQELSTIIRWNVDPIILLLDNGSYAIENAHQEAPHHFLQPWHYSAMAQVYSEQENSPIFAATVREVKELQAALRNATRRQGPALVQCILPPNVPEEMKTFAKFVSRIKLEE